MVNNGGNFYKDLYTAITRSSQGSIILSNESNIKSVEDSETHSENLGETAIATFAQSRK